MRCDFSLRQYSTSRGIIDTRICRTDAFVFLNCCARPIGVTKIHCCYVQEPQHMEGVRGGMREKSIDSGHSCLSAPAKPM